MSDEPVTASTEPTPVAEPIEAMDPDGVPWRNRVAEANRKQAEAEAAKSQADAQIQQYQVALGQQNQPQPTPEPLSDKFDDATLKMVDERAEQKARTIVQEETYRIARGAELAKVLEDPDIRAEAVVEYNAMKANPMYANKDDMDMQYLATNSARATIAERRLANPPDLANPQVTPPNRTNASLPPTRPSLAPAPDTESPDADLDHYWAQDESQQMFVKSLRSLGYTEPLDLNSEDIVNFGGEKVTVKDLAKRIAVRAVRTGIQLSESNRGAFEAPITPPTGANS